MPMGFDLTEEQQQVKRSVREFAEAEIKPHVMEWDEDQRLPREIFTKMGELGLMGVLFPEEYGGAGMGYVEYATVIEEIARVDGSIGLSVAAHNSLCTNHIFQYGNEEQRKKYVTQLASSAGSTPRSRSCRIPASAIATAISSPGHVWGPQPNVNARRDGRSGSSLDGSGLAAGSRLAAARTTSTTSPASSSCTSRCPQWLFALRSIGC